MDIVGQQVVTKKKSFALGYSYLGHGFLSWLLYSAAASGGLNTLIPMYAAANNLDVATLTSWMFPAGILSCLFAFIIGKILVRVGARATTTIFAILAGTLGTLPLLVTHSIAGFAFTCIFAQGLIHGYSLGASNTIITNWFPRKKGWALGITTAGLMAASLTYVRIMNNIGTLSGIVWFLSLSLIIFGVASWFWVRNTPEEVGLYPDNIIPQTTEEKAEYEQLRHSPRYKSTWTVPTVLKQPQAWLIMIFAGIGSMGATGATASTVLYLTEGGFDLGTALTLFGVLSLVSIVGSILIGMMDTKLGPRKAAIFMGVIGAISFVLPIIFKVPAAYVLSSLGINFSLGASANLFASLIGSQFGRKEFATVFTILNIGNMLIRSFAFLLIGAGVVALGSYAAAYAVFGALFVVAVILVFFIKDKTVIPVPAAKDSAR